MPETETETKAVDNLDNIGYDELKKKFEESESGYIPAIINYINQKNESSAQFKVLSQLIENKVLDANIRTMIIVYDSFAFPDNCIIDFCQLLNKAKPHEVLIEAIKFGINFSDKTIFAVISVFAQTFPETKHEVTSEILLNCYQHFLLGYTDITKFVEEYLKSSESDYQKLMQMLELEVGLANKLVVKEPHNFETSFVIYASRKRDLLKQAATIDKKALSEIKRSSEPQFNEADEAKEPQKKKRKVDLTQVVRTLGPRINVHENRYNMLKELMQSKVQKLGIEKPLIAYNENNLTIEIGYDQGSFWALFAEVIKLARPVLLPKEYAYNLQDSFNHFYMDPSYQQKLVLERREIRKKAKEYKFPESRQYQPLTKENIAINTEKSEDLSPKSLFLLSIAAYRGLIIGEQHKHLASKKFLLDNLKAFKNEGLTVLYLEHLLDSQQTWLDQYYQECRKNPDAAMPIELKAYLEQLDKSWNLSESCSFTELVAAFVKDGIRVVGIDSAATYFHNIKNSAADLADIEKSIDRYRLLNFKAADIITASCGDKDKFLVFVGSSHVADFDKVPGLSTLLHCPHIVVNEVNNYVLGEEKMLEPASAIEVTKTISYPGRQLRYNFDLVLNLATPLQQMASDHQRPQPLQRTQSFAGALKNAEMSQGSQQTFNF